MVNTNKIMCFVEISRLGRLKKIRYGFLFGMGFMLISCTEKLNESQNTIGNSGAAVTDVNAAGKHSERRAKGDTLALSYKELQRYLPEEVGGYTLAETPEGESVEIPGMSFSVAEKKYKKGSSHLTISLYDYNGAYAMYEGATALFTDGVPVKNESEEAKMIMINNNIKGWESFRRKDKKCEIRMGMGERFYLTLKADQQQGTDQLKIIANSLPLDSLNNL